MSWDIPENEQNTEIWSRLKDELSRMYEGEIQLVRPKECNERCFQWFHILEEEDFRYELRYTQDEITQRLTYPDVLFFFILRGDTPEILVLGYRLHDCEKPTFYLDTLAVRQRGRGIGHVVMSFVINRARSKQYHAILLDTEEKDEKGIPLQRFYQKHGFETVSHTESGDLIMKLTLTTNHEPVQIQNC